MAGVPIAEFYANSHAIIEPVGIEIDGIVPDRAVLCFFQDLIDRFGSEGVLVKVGEGRTTMGIHSIYRYRCETMTGKHDVLVFNPGVGAPLAVLLTECIIAAGVRNLIACGGCGVLNPEIMANHPVILTSAVRDEGTSYH